MGKTRRRQKKFFDDDSMYDLDVDDLIAYASNVNKKKRSGSKKRRQNWEDEYFDYLDAEDPPLDEKENK
tara:strand:- start:376 stop:582 length:207 start_codon:yes stop_codon:yes gene_type:complete